VVGRHDPLVNPIGALLQHLVTLGRSHY
jgi:hypothetical protein